MSNEPSRETGVVLPPLRIAVVGGTGAQGRGLGYRFARHGHHVVIGSRTADKAQAGAAEIAARLRAEGGAGSGEVTGDSNDSACAQADLVVLAVPYAGHDDLVAGLPLAGKVVVSCVNPLRFDQHGPVGDPVEGGEGSAAETAQRLAPQARVVGAFHHVAAASLWSDQEYLSGEDVMVCGEDAEAVELVARLAATVTSREGLVVGGLRLARQLEPFTAVLISLNKRYRCRSGLKLHL